MTEETVFASFEQLSGARIEAFSLLRFIGAGNVGYVYEARWEKVPDFPVAVKIVPGQPEPGSERELQKVSQLSTIPGVVHLHSLGTGQLPIAGRTQLFQFSVWDYISPGQTLRQYVASLDQVSVSFVVAVVEAVLKVLHACQQRGFERHGDLHDRNILIGKLDPAHLDEEYRPRLPLFVSDFGFRSATGAKGGDDYAALGAIASSLLERVNRRYCTSSDRELLDSVVQILRKTLLEPTGVDRQEPVAILRALSQARRTALYPPAAQDLANGDSLHAEQEPQTLSVGQFQLSEMLGENWQWWNALFVPSVPGRSRILEPDIPTVVTGPRGCGKTMLFRRLSARLVLECGAVARDYEPAFTGFYVNANDIADAFPYFPDLPTDEYRARLLCYLNICCVSEFLTVLSTRSAKLGEAPAAQVVEFVSRILGKENSDSLIVGEDAAEHLRAEVEGVKWRFADQESSGILGDAPDLGRHDWLPYFFRQARALCHWLATDPIFLFLDDYTTPRISDSMQRVLNRALFQRSAMFVAKVATEAATTFVTEDSSGKILQDGDDYQLVDMGEESLLLDEREREIFLGQVFEKRLRFDSRVPKDGNTLQGLLGKTIMAKTELARCLRGEKSPESVTDKGSRSDRRRGRTKAKAIYHGSTVFTGLWSGDTRTMIQVIQDLLDEAMGQETQLSTAPIGKLIQDRVFRNRGAQWLEAANRMQPTDREAVAEALESMRREESQFDFAGGSYGAHLKAIVEAFVFAARKLLFGPTYKIRDGRSVREVPRMAFRLEIVDDFRISGLASELYIDLLRYGLFLRDARGKSVRGAMVPRLYLRRLLLPYCSLALSKRDSVPLTCEQFERLLLYPDAFKRDLGPLRSPSLDIDQLTIPTEEE